VSNRISRTFGRWIYQVPRERARIYFFESTKLLDLIFQRDISYLLLLHAAHVELSLLWTFRFEEEAKCAAIAGLGAEANFAAMKLTYFPADIETQARAAVYLNSFRRSLPMLKPVRLHV
jgi:hypothetical protein